MAWAEVSLATTPEHETLIDALYDIFFRTDLASSSTSEEQKEEEFVPRSRPWVPHLSMCYDNPEGLGTNLCRSLMARYGATAPRRRGTASDGSSTARDGASAAAMD